MAAIVGLPLVGDYTAKATALTLGTGSEIPLDTNILRITKRMWGNMSSGELTKRLNIWAADNVREVFFALIDLGAFVCRPTNPKCSTCPISISCVNRRRLDT
jgi:A/G-specific adenine glycosylase